MRSKIKLMPGRRQRMGPAVKNTRKPGHGMQAGRAAGPLPFPERIYYHHIT